MAPEVVRAPAGPGRRKGEWPAAAAAGAETLPGAGTAADAGAVVAVEALHVVVDAPGGETSAGVQLFAGGTPGTLLGKVHLAGMHGVKPMHVGSCMLDVCSSTGGQGRQHISCSAWLLVQLRPSTNADNTPAFLVCMAHHCRGS